MTFLEFNYMLMQAVDFLELNRRYGCTLQMGGSDQWGNIVNGVELIRRVDQKPAFGLTTPLLTTASGAKMGKTAAGRGLAQRRHAAAPTTTGSSGATPRTPTSAASCACSPTCRWTRSPGWRRSQGAEINDAKKVLADAATAMLHGADAAATAARRRREPPSSRARCRPTCRPSRLPAPSWRPASIAGRLAADAGLAASQRRGAPPGPGRRPAPQRRGRSPTAARLIDAGRPQRRRRASSWRPARRRSCWSGRSDGDPMTEITEGWRHGPRTSTCPPTAAASRWPRSRARPSCSISTPRTTRPAAPPRPWTSPALAADFAKAGRRRSSASRKDTGEEARPVQGQVRPRASPRLRRGRRDDRGLRRLGARRASTAASTWASSARPS